MNMKLRSHGNNTTLIKKKTLQTKIINVIETQEIIVKSQF